MKQHGNISAVANNSQMHNVFLKAALILFPSLGRTPVWAFKGEWLTQRPTQQEVTLTEQQTVEEEEGKKKVCKFLMFMASESAGSSGFCQIYQTAMACMARKTKTLKHFRLSNPFMSSKLFKTKLSNTRGLDSLQITADISHQLLIRCSFTDFFWNLLLWYFLKRRTFKL